MLATYKVFYKKGTRFKLGEKMISVDDYDPWPPEDQIPALEVVYQLNRGRVPPELNREWNRRHKLN